MKLALATVVAFSSTLGLAQNNSVAGTGAVGKAAAQGAGDAYLAKEFWDKNAKDGYLSKEAVARFKGADGKGVDMQKIDLDKDGRVSEPEWTTYQQTAGAAGKSPQGSTEGQSSNK